MLPTLHDVMQFVPVGLAVGAVYGVSGVGIVVLYTLLSLDARVIVPGHGPVSTTARADLQLTRDYLAYLRRTMGEAARNMEPFDEAYARTDWSAYEKMPLFGPANRMNAYNTYLLMERESAPK